MAPRPRAWHILQTAKQEALLAVDLYNRANRDRSLEGFIVHMSIAWLYLCHAIFTQRQVDYRYWKKVEGRRRLQREDGEPKTWDLRQCLRKLYSDENDPVRRNVEFFIAFRNMIEHRQLEHSFIPATIEQLFGLGPLTNRDAGVVGLQTLATLSAPRNVTTRRWAPAIAMQAAYES